MSKFELNHLNMINLNLSLINLELKRYILQKAEQTAEQKAEQKLGCTN